MATLNDVKADLFAYFAKNETFTMDEKADFDKVCVLSLNPPLDKQLIRAALKEYEKQGIITDVSYKIPGETPDQTIYKECWILNKPIEQYSQSVELNYATIITLTKLVNNFCVKNNANESFVNPLAIIERDIQSLIVIAGQALEEANEQSE